ncbi:MAG TPA: TolC family protein [Thermoanaerobaculia bacterium]|nr:TolC family protein [Thermoanaerobaculia bacterium]
MKTKSVFGALFLAAAAVAAVGPAPVRALEPLPEPDWLSRLREAISRAAARNPEVAAMEARILAARHRVDQATALPDPEVELALKDVPVSSPSLSRDDFTMETIAARQRFPGAGKLPAEKRAAEAELEGMAAEHARHVVEIAADVTDSFLRIASLDRRLAIARETRQRLSDALTAARERYAVGKGAQADVLRANLEKTALDDRLAGLAAERRSEAARANALQGLPADTQVVPFVVGSDVESRIASRPVPPAGELLERAERDSAAIAAAAAGVRRGQARLEGARLERRPDWTVMSYYAHRVSFEDLAGISVSFGLPWVHPKRLQARQAELEADLEGARADLSAARNALRRDIEAASAELARNREQARLYRELILPQAEINYRAAREAYQVGAIDFLTYVRAATDLGIYEAEAVEREAGAARSVAALQKASGLPLIEGTPAPGGSHED